MYTYEGTETACESCYIWNYITVEVELIRVVEKNGDLLLEVEIRKQKVLIV